MAPVTVIDFALAIVSVMAMVMASSGWQMMNQVGLHSGVPVVLARVVAAGRGIFTQTRNGK